MAFAAPAQPDPVRSLLRFYGKRVAESKARAESGKRKLPPGVNESGEWPRTPVKRLPRRKCWSLAAEGSRSYRRARQSAATLPLPARRIADCAPLAQTNCP